MLNLILSMTRESAWKSLISARFYTFSEHRSQKVIFFSFDFLILNVFDGVEKILIE